MGPVCVSGLGHLGPLKTGHLFCYEPVIGFLTIISVSLISHQRAICWPESHHTIHLGELRPLPLLDITLYLEPKVVDSANGVLDIRVADPKVSVDRLRELDRLLHLGKEGPILD